MREGIELLLHQLLIVLNSILRSLLISVIYLTLMNTASVEYITFAKILSSTVTSISSLEK